MKKPRKSIGEIFDEGKALDRATKRAVRRAVREGELLQFIEAIVADVKSKQKVDEKYVFALGWSSGGPPLYAETLKSGSPVKGAFVAMSVFKPDQLPALENAKGKAFYILQSPDDKVVPARFADAARDQLAAKGAKTKLDTYEGGHGWHGDVFGQIRKGLDWLEASAGK